MFNVPLPLDTCIGLYIGDFGDDNVSSMCVVPKCMTQEVISKYNNYEQRANFIVGASDYSDCFGDV